MAFDDIDEVDILARVMEQAREETRSSPPARPEADKPDSSSGTWTMPGILGSTRVQTSFGLVPAHLVRAGDTLKTREGGYLKVLRVRDLKIDEPFLAHRPDAAPVLIRRNALGANVPAQDIGLSPAQAVAIGPNRFEGRMVPAEELSRLRGKVDGSLGMLVYVQFHLEREALINCDGVWVAGTPI